MGRHPQIAASIMSGLAAFSLVMMAHYWWQLGTRLLCAAMAVLFALDAAWYAFKALGGGEDR